MRQRLVDSIRWVGSIVVVVIAGIVSIVLYDKRDEIWRDVTHTSASTWALLLYLPTLLIMGGFIVYLLLLSRQDRATLERVRQSQDETQRQAEIDDQLLGLDDTLIRLIPTMAPDALLDETTTRIVRGLLKDTTEVFPRKVYRAYILRPDPAGTYLVPWIGYQMSEETMKRTRFLVVGGANPQMGVAGETFLRGVVLVAHKGDDESIDARSYVEFDPHRAIRPYQSFVAVPVVGITGDCIGVLCLDSGSDATVFDAEGIKGFLLALGNRIAAVILLYEQLLAVRGPAPSSPADQSADTAPSQT